ncbi:MAG: LptF/LptG family permease [Bacteroidetes bacterium]|nr:LptF/LptG family permease [Bacteroidota bacterium]MCB9043745.1 LptF/LptG family permease [Chitinophagales bacterium]
MKIIDRLILKSFWGPFILTFCIALFVLIMQFLWKYIDDLVGKGLEPLILVELMFYLSASMVPLAIPLAVLLSSILTFGKMGEQYELVALKAAGISLQRFMLPAAVLALLLSGVAFLFANYMLPVANLKFHSMMYSVIQKRPTLNLKPGVFFDGIEGYSIFVGEKDEDNVTIRNVMIYDHHNGSYNNNILLAQSGQMFTSEDGNYLFFNLTNGNKYEELSESQGTPRAKVPERELMRYHFDKHEMVIDLSSLGFEKKDEDLFKTNQQMMSVKQLKYYSDSLQQQMNTLDNQLLSRLKPFYACLRDSTFSPVAAAASKGNDLKEFIHLPIQLDWAKVAKMANDDTRRAKNYVDWNISQQKYLVNREATYDYTLHKKISLAFSCFVLFLIGAPLGAIIRKGGLGMPMLMAIIFFMLFHIIDTIGKKLAQDNILNAWEGAWLAVIILLPLAVYLIIKAANDSAVFNIDSYQRRLKELFKRIPFFAQKTT